MYKRLNILDFDIPKDDVDCWNRYAQHRWVYDLSRLLDAQNIKWSPFPQCGLTHKTINMSLTSMEQIDISPSQIYIEKPLGLHIQTEVYIVKGEIRHMSSNTTNIGENQAALAGQIELLINAFVTLYFVKFTGIITCVTIGQNIYKIQLRSNSDLSITANTNTNKLIKRLYRRTQATLSGLTDQALHESFAS